jgi:hypothetical protein
MCVRKVKATRNTQLFGDNGTGICAGAARISDSNAAASNWSIIIAIAGARRHK